MHLAPSTALVERWRHSLQTEATILTMRWVGIGWGGVGWSKCKNVLVEEIGQWLHRNIKLVKSERTVKLIQQLEIGDTIETEKVQKNYSTDKESSDKD